MWRLIKKAIQENDREDKEQNVFMVKVFENSKVMNDFDWDERQAINININIVIFNYYTFNQWKKFIKSRLMTYYLYFSIITNKMNLILLINLKKTKYFSAIALDLKIIFCIV